MYIIGAYCVYYLGNVIYDLFLAKEKVPKENDDGVIISLGEITENDNQPIAYVSVDDVETVTLPNSFDASEDEIFSSENTEEIQLDKLKEQFEEEKYLEQEEQEKTEFQTQLADFSETKSLLKSVLALKAQNIISEAKEIISNNNSKLDDWDSFIEKATTNVVLTSNNDGHKVFKSTLH